MLDVKLLDKIKFFSDFTREERTSIAELEDTVFRKFHENEPIVNEGEPGESFFIVLKGSANVYKKPNANPIATLGPGSIFGEVSFLSPRIRTASVSAVDPCIVLEFAKKITQKLPFAVYDKLKDKLIGLLIKHLDDIIDIRTKDHFALTKKNPFEEGKKMKGIQQKIKIFSDGDYHIFYLGNTEALLENSRENSSKKVTMVELSNRLPPKYVKFITESKQDPADYLFGKVDEYTGYIVPKAAQSAWKSVLTAFRAEQMTQSHAVQVYQKLDNIY